MKRSTPDQIESAGDAASAVRLQGRILGIKIRQARQDAGRTLEDCADRLRVVPEELEAWEYGEAVPNRAQLEALARLLDVRLDRLWQEPKRAAGYGPDGKDEEYRILRQRVTGCLLRAAREAMGLSIEKLSRPTAISVECLREYELGERDLPADHLHVLAKVLDRPPGYFREGESAQATLVGSTGQPQTEPELPEALHRLELDEKTLGLLKLAAAFSQIPSEELHRIASALMSLSEARGNKA